MRRTGWMVLMVAVLGSAAAPAWAAGSLTKVATVNGLVCDFCAQAIAQALGLKPGVEDVKIDLSAKTVTVRMAADSPLRDDTRLAALLKEAGYDTVGIATR